MEHAPEMIAWLRAHLGRQRCSYWAWHEVEGDWYLMRCVRHRWHVTMHLIDPLADRQLT